MDDLFSGDSVPPGYRLHRVEIMNWGTFDSMNPTRIHTAELGGKTSLLIGQNGSGKSTLADAVITLLVRPQVRNYNVAAGSHGRKRERNESTYIKGAYAHGSSEDDNRAKTKFLRPEGKHFSGILAYFENEAQECGFTLAQLLWLDSSQRTKRYCCFAKGEVRATEAFGELKLDRLKKQLETRGFRVTDNFTTYEKWLRTETGMLTKAMDVFNQTVSVKDIQSLNQFIRRHMLQGKPWRESLENILGHFDQLSEAHRLLVDARKQMEALQPVIDLGGDYERLSRDLKVKRDRSAACDAFFRQRTVELCEAAGEEWQNDLSRIDSEVSVMDERLAGVRERTRKLKNDLDTASGERLRELPGQIEKAEVQLKSLRRDKERYFSALKKAALTDPVRSSEQFEERKRQLRSGIGEGEKQLESHFDNRFALDLEKRAIDADIEEVSLDVKDLQERPSKLPRPHQEMRRQLCDALEIDPRRLPFAAELIRVNPENRDWEASAETILRSFGLSLLVPKRFYREVSQYVNQNRIVDESGRGQRLVYLKVPDSHEDLELDRYQEPEPRTLYHKLEVRPNHPLTGWVKNELCRRADFLCCDTLEEFQYCKGRAVTRERQVRSGNHHEKDDRSRALDSRNHILGWDNREKVQLLREELSASTQRAEVVAGKLETATRQIDLLTARIDGMRTAMIYENFTAIDTASQEQLIADLVAEKERLEFSDDGVQALTIELRSAEKEEAGTEKAKMAKLEERGGILNNLNQARELLETARGFITTCSEEGKLEAYAANFEEIASDVADRELTIHTIANESASYRRELDASIAEVSRKLAPIEKKISSAMSRFLRDFPGVATSESLEAAPAYLPEFISVYQRIKADDLPRYETRFRERLRDKVLDEISLFQTMLGNEADAIKEKIDVLNESLEKINYDEKHNTVMRLEPLPTKDKEIAEFRQQLRECTSGLLENSEEALESCYQRVEKLIAALRSENTRWRDKVIDVREWFDFVARETVRDTGEEINFHSDSQGQSGGEKAKLAFTILVAAVVYQFDIDPDDHRSSRFHFVVVDEMFSKVDDHYATYAMRLFAQFGLQLLIVAPFDAKAKVTEPFVDVYLHVVKKDNRSQVFTMTSEEFRDRF